MTRFYDIDAANAAVGELDGIVRLLVEQRAELVRLRDEVLASGLDRARGTGRRPRSRTAPSGPSVRSSRPTRHRWTTCG